MASYKLLIKSSAAKSWRRCPILTVACSASLGILVEFLEDSSILGSPLNKSIRAATLNHRCGRARTRELHISRKPIEAVLLDEGAIGDQLLAKSDDMWPSLRGLALLQHSRRTLKHHEAIGCAMTATFSALHATKKSAARLLLSRGLGDWDEKIGSEYRQQLANAGKENLHLLPIGLWKLRTASLVLLEHKPADFGCLGQEPALEVSHMSFGEVLVLTDEHDSRNPKLLGLVLLEALANNSASPM